MADFVPYTAYRNTATDAITIRRDKPQRRALMEQALAYAERYAPVTLRQLFYLLVNNGWLYKIEREYKNLGTLLTKMRRGEVEVEMDWDLIIDAGRETRVATTWSGPREIVDAVMEEYRRDIWADQPRRVYIGTEKEALSAILRSVADVYAVPVIVAKGYPSATYQHDLAEEFYECEQPIHLFYYGDHDPSGDGISDLFERILLMNDNYDAGHTFIRSALTAEQIIAANYLTRPPKATDSRTANWDDGGAEAADVDAIPPDELRDMIRADIESIIDMRLLATTLDQQEEDLTALKKMAEAL